MNKLKNLERIAKITKKYIHKLYIKCDRCNALATIIEYDNSGTGYFCSDHIPKDGGPFLPVGDLEPFKQDEDIIELFNLLKEVD